MSTTDSNPRGDRRQAGQPAFRTVLAHTVQGALLALSVLSICLLMPPLASDAAGRSPAHASNSKAADAAASLSVPVHDYHLGNGFHGVVFPDASVRIQSRTSTVTETLFVTEVAPPPRARAAAVGHQDRQLYTAVVAEGAAAGQRGFSRDADDDRDGAVDEDRLDGRDNDGDGRRDEDYAAISDAMTVVNVNHAGQVLHLESYHWAYANVLSTLLLSYRAEDQSSQAVSRDLVLRLTTGEWQRAVVVGRSRLLGSKEARQECTAFVSGRSDPADPSRQIWLGVTMLEAPQARAKPSTRMYVEDGLVEVPFLDGEARLALCVAPTLLQLSTQLAAAHSVFLGASDPVTGQSVGWIVPPQPPADGPARTTPAQWYLTDTGGQLVLAFQPGHDDYFDPDLFVLDSQTLGAPEAITWMPADSAPVKISWRQLRPDDLDTITTGQSDPYGQLYSSEEQALAGHLVFHFASAPEVPRHEKRLAGAVERGLSAVTLAGETVTLAVEWIGAGTEDLAAGGAATGMTTGMTAGMIAAAPAGPGSATGAGNDTGNDTGSDNHLADRAAETDADEPGLDAELERDLRNSNQRPALNPELLGNYPNPFREVTTISFAVPSTVQEGFVWADDQEPLLAPQSAMPYRSGQPLVSVRVYSINGQELATLFAEYASTGQYNVSWDGTDVLGRSVASGTYFCKLQIENWSVTRRLVFIR